MKLESLNLLRLVVPPDLEGDALAADVIEALREFHKYTPGDPRDKARAFEKEVKEIQEKGIKASRYDPNSGLGKLDRAFGALQKSKLGKWIHG